MDVLSGFRRDRCRCYYRPAGTASDGILADMMTEALALAIERSATEALINITGVYGFGPPGPAYRRWLVRRWADLVARRVRVALVVREEHLCPQRTGSIVAADEGMHANIFTNEADATSWLDSFGDST